MRSFSRARERAFAVAVISLGLAASTAQSQDSARVRTESFVGSALVALDATYQRPGGGSDFQGRLTFAPFVDSHWQLGFSPTWASFSDSTNHSSVGTVAVSANYLPLDGNVSRPYLGAYLSEGGTTGSGYGVFGLQAGWLRFLTPSSALRAEFRFRTYSTARFESDELLLALEPYLFGRAVQRATSLPGFGAFDVSLLADYTMRPSKSLFFDAAAAPFLTRWLQVGGIVNYERYSATGWPRLSSGATLFPFGFAENAHHFELFSRGYLPIQTRLVPFADAFVANESFGYSSFGSAGARLGVRSYLSAGVALDAAYQWRRFGDVSFLPRDERTLRIGFMTQFRAR